jgi:vacuolar-type H+-ATPase subunit F/Vma7
MTENFSDAGTESEESLLVQARALLDAKNVDSAARAAFFTSFEAVVASDDPDITLAIPQPLTGVWKDVLKLVGRYINETPPQEPPTADEQLYDLISRSIATPPVSFAERVSTSPVRGSTPRAAADAGPASPTFDSESASTLGSSAEPRPLHTVEMTESDYELLQEKIKKRRESQSKSAIITIPETSDVPSDEVHDDAPLDASAVGAAVSSDFKIDLVESVSEST